MVNVPSEILFLISLSIESIYCKPPHIIFIMADDLVSIKSDQNRMLFLTLILYTQNYFGIVRAGMMWVSTGPTKYQLPT